MKQIYNPVVDRIMSLVKHQVETVEAEGHKVSVRTCLSCQTMASGIVIRLGLTTPALQTVRYARRRIR